LSPELLQDIAGVQKGTIAVYALNGQALRAATSYTGFAKALEELRKRRG
jgi:hypothetical protein